MGKGVHVIVLAGGYSTAVLQGADAAGRAAAAAASKPGAALAALPSLASSGAVTPALIPLDGTPAVVRVLRALQAVRRIGLQAVWVVHNAGDAASFKGAGGLFGVAPASDLSLPAVNFLDNGATGPHNWEGEAADLGTALAAIGGKDVCVAAISASLAFLPNYNMQRLLEHSYLRGRDVMGFSHLSGMDIELLGDTGFTGVVPGDETALPRIERLEPSTPVDLGSKVAEPYLFLRPESVAVVAGSGGGRSAPGAGLPDVAGRLLAAGTYVAAIDLMFGRYNLRTARAVDYADRFLAFCAAAAIDPSSVGLKPEDVLRPYSTTPGGENQGVLPPPPAAGSCTGRSTAADFRFDELNGTASKTDSPHGTDYDVFLRCATAFNKRFFGDVTSSSRAPAPGMKHYLLPPTFYMTAYRRQGADIML